MRYLVLLHLTDGKKVVVDEVGESSGRGGLKEMKNLGKRSAQLPVKNLRCAVSSFACLNTWRCAPQADNRDSGGEAPVKIIQKYKPRRDDRTFCFLD